MKKENNVVYKNPFPVTAVANFYNSTQNDMIVETKAIKKIKRILDEWMIEEKDGITVAVQGEYGTGKTQLAIEIQRYLKKYSEKKYHFICLDSPASTFLEMYKNRFLNEVTKFQVLERLELYYYELIVQDMINDDIYKKIIQENKAVKSIKLIEKFGLPKSKYDRLFEVKLEEVTQNVKFVPALLLLLESGFEKDVWNWFNGAEPTEAMKERGVKFTINNDIYALESIGVFAFLFGQQDHKFVLFIDEMEKIVSNTETINMVAYEALKKLIETVKATKTILILCGLPDYYVALPRDIQQRIAYQIKTEAILLKEIKEYICIANDTINNNNNILPFNEKNLKDILEISNGNIRTIIRLLFHSGNWYMKNGKEIDGKALYEILIDAYGDFDLNVIKKALVQIFISKGWIFDEQKKHENSLIDFWLPSILTKRESMDDGIEVYVVQNVLSEGEYIEVNERICVNSNNCKICVIEGFINEQFYKQLSEKNMHIIKFRTPEFEKIFVSVIEGEKAKFENNIKQNDFSIVNEKIEQLSRVMNRAISDLNENFIGKQEFYYFINRILSKEKEEVYMLPDKDSEFYILLNEINRLIDSFGRNRNDSGEVGVLFLLREFSYILYYIVEKSNNLKIYVTIIDIYEVYRNLNMITEFISQNCGSMFNRITSRFRFVLDYLCFNVENRENVINSYREIDKERLFMDVHYDNDFFSTSKKLKQVSQNFCAELLINNPDVIKRYDRIFVSFYYLMYVIEPSIIKGDLVEYDNVILREYYDLMREYFRSYKMFDSEKKLKVLFRNYEVGLRRLINE